MAGNRQQFILGDHEREVEIPDVLKATVGGRLHEPGALPSARDSNIAVLGIVNEPAGEGVVRHQRLGQRFPDDLGRLAAVLEHVERQHHVPEASDAIDDGEKERLGRSGRGRRDEGLGGSGDGEAHGWWPSGAEKSCVVRI